MNIKTALTFLLIFLPAILSFAGKEYIIQPAMADDIVLKSADAESIEAYRNNSDFKYKEMPAYEQYSFLPVWLRQFLNKLLNNIFNSGALEAVFILLITSIAVYILLRMNGINPAGLLKRSPRELKNAVYSGFQEQHLIQYDKLIDEAVMAGDFRLAVRLRFLDILMKLDQKGIISFKEDKTNREYYNEIAQPSVKKGFSGVAGIFENVWYGELELSKNQYTELDNVLSKLGKGMGL